MGPKHMRFSILSLCASLLIGLSSTAAHAETYSCTVNNKAAKGWIPNNFAFTRTAGSKKLGFAARFNNGYLFGPGDWKVVADTGQKLVASFDWVVAPNESKTPNLGALPAASEQEDA